MDLIFKYHLSIEKYHIHIIYEGQIDETITAAFISLAEKNMNKKEEGSKLIRKVYHIMVEFLQNMHKHADNPDKYDSLYNNRGIFLMASKDDGYVVLSGNYVLKSKIPDLQDLLMKVNFMGAKEVKDYYQRKILNEGLSAKGGAGLGLVDIIRRAESKLEYRFENIDEKYSFFILKTYIAK
jgi:hypothetical protein